MVFEERGPINSDAARRRSAASQARALVAETAGRIERALSWIRIVFCAVMLARFLIVTDVLTPGRLAATLIPMTVVIAFSIFVLVRPPEHIDVRTRMVSVTLDALVCFFALLPNALWPALDSPILMHKPDIATILIVVFAGGFRLSRHVAAWSAIVNGLCFVALVRIDFVVSATPQPVVASSIYAVLIVAAAGLALLVGWKTEDLVAEGAERAVAAQIHRRNLGVLLRDHHDVRSSLSAATLATELASRALVEREATVATQQLRAARESLQEVNDASRRAREMSLEELDALDAVAPADIEAVLTSIASTPRTSDELRVEVSSTATAFAAYAGGAKGLSRSLRRLLHNAAEGRGAARATRVWLEAVVEDDHVVLRIEDDGPGFADEQLDDVHDAPVATTKRGGTGVGLLLVRSAVEFSGGRFSKANRASGGASLTIRLPRVSAPLT